MTTAKAYKTLEHCKLTDSKAKILYPYIDKKSDPWFVTYGGMHTGIDVEGYEIYAYCSGVVLAIGNDKEYNMVSVQYDKNVILRYGNLKTVSVSVGEIIYTPTLIGYADRYLHFEYASTKKEDSVWVVRIGAKTYYKHNPELILDGTVYTDGAKTKVVQYDIDPDMEIMYEYVDNRMPPGYMRLGDVE